MKLFHGTLSSFSEFDVSKTSRESRVGRGIYLSSSYDDAHMYAQITHPDVANKLEDKAIAYAEIAFDIIKRATLEKSIPRVLLVDLDIKKPLILSEENPTFFLMNQTWTKN